MSTRLEIFAKQLSVIIGNPTKLRPFVCDGSPLACEIFIVGSNPATEMDNSFWEYWNNESGFDKARWLDDYEKARMVKKGKINPSSTRERINRIVQAASPKACLETNVYWKPSAHENDLKREDKNSQGFKFLINEIHPQSLLMHGKSALKAISDIARVEFVRDEITVVDLGYGPVKVIAASPLYLWSYEKASAVGEKL
ncbi:MAG: hypothetical protein ACOZB3_08755 [Calditrichota bacterium]